jgi:hypothetical protein
MIERFLRAKHWQIFIVIFIIPYSLQIIAMTINKNDIERIGIISPFIMVIFFLALFGWFWSIATGLLMKIPEGIKMKIRKFKTLVIIPMVYIPLAFGLMNSFFDIGANASGEPNGAMIGFSFMIMFPLHILSIFGLLYSFYYVAKTFKTVELQRETTFSDFAGDFFLFLIFPVGVWVIQPKINLIVNGLVKDAS